MICIFPEGKLTKTGEMNEFKRGIEKIVERNPVPVIPMALRGMWGSFFSHKYGQALKAFPRRFWSKVELVIDKAILPEQINAKELQSKTLELRGEMR